MFESFKIKKKIKRLKEEIEFTEKRRERSQAALVEAILTKTDPNDDDVDFFNKYTQRITLLRDEMHRLESQLKGQNAPHN